jgi:hypothetical protein
MLGDDLKTILHRGIDGLDHRLMNAIGDRSAVLLWFPLA